MEEERMNRRSLSLIALFIIAALPLSASQFIELPFDRVARESALIVRGHVESTWSAWDDAHEVIFTYATVRVTRYFGEATGPDTLVVREVGGTVDGYRQEAIGFPELRTGENVVLMLSQWEDGSEMRMHAFNQGKFLVRQRGIEEVLVADPVRQGEARLEHDGRFDVRAEADAPGLAIHEFAKMVDDARAGIPVGTVRRDQ
jgi:hypothetical protein